MSILPLLPADVAEPGELVAAIRARRGGTLFNLDRMLLHSPPFARGWNAFMSAVRRELSAPPQLCELAICLVAVLNAAEYEFVHHAPEYLRAGGTQAALDALRVHGADVAERAGEVFDADARAVLRMTVAMTRDVQVPEALQRELRAALGSDRAAVEIIGTIAAYNMVSRFLVATGVTPE